MKAIKYIFIKYRQYKLKARKFLLMSMYLISQHRQNIKKLSSYGLSNIRIYRFKFWHRHLKLGKSPSDPSIRRYYTAELNGVKCFVKTMTDSVTARNEIFINKYLHSIGLSCVPRIFLIDENYMNGVALLVVEFKPRMRTFSIPDGEKDFEDLCAQLERIHALFYEFNIVHLDLHPENVLIDENNKVMIIDFGIAWIPNTEVYQKRLYFRGVPSADGLITYDNAYYFIKMFSDCGIPDSFRQKECYGRIERLVGRHTYTLKLPEEQKVKRK